MAYERLSSSDVTFLHLEGPCTHMHVASLAVFEGSVDYEQTVDAIRRRLHLVPRFRQKLAFVPGGQGRPVWVDDHHFRLEYHVRHTALPAPRSETQLRNLCGRVLSQQLDRTKPLWEMWLIDGLEGRTALLTKTHHCLVDGVAGADLTAALLDLEPDPPPVEPAQWDPSPVPSPTELLMDALRERTTEPAEMLRSLRRLIRTPRRLAAGGADVLEGLGALAWAGLNPAPPCPLNGRIGPHRRFETVQASLEDFKAVKNTHGGTVNDVVLTVVTGALRAFLERRGEDIRGLDLKAMVPVSTRADHERGALGNRVSAMVATLPVYEPDPVERLRLISRSMLDVKESRQAVGAEAIMALSGFASQTIVAQAARLQSRQRFFNLLITNVPGPQFPLYGMGRELVELYPAAPLSENQALNVAAMSYNGRMGFGILGDYDAVPDLHLFAQDVKTSAQELERTARPRTKPRRSRPAGRAATS